MRDGEQHGGNGQLMHVLGQIFGGGGGGAQQAGGGQGGGQWGGGGLMQTLGQIFGGGGGGQGGGGNVSLQSLLGLLGGPQGMTNYQQVFTVGAPPSPIGGIDIPPANMGDPFGGRGGEINPGDFHTSPFGIFSSTGWGGGGFGQTPTSGFGQGGSPTALPTYWTNIPGVGYVPSAVPNIPGGWLPPVGEDISRHTPQLSTV